MLFYYLVYFADEVRSEYAQKHVGGMYAVY